jgi:hypothetical protein
MNDDLVYIDNFTSPSVSHPTASTTFNPAYQVARCGQGSVHGPHVVDHGPDQPRNCPGTGQDTTVTRPSPTASPDA